MNIPQCTLSNIRFTNHSHTRPKFVQGMEKSWRQNEAMLLDNACDWRLRYPGGRRHTANECHHVNHPVFCTLRQDGKQIDYGQYPQDITLIDNEWQGFQPNKFVTRRGKLVRRKTLDAVYECWSCVPLEVSMLLQYSVHVLEQILHWKTSLKPAVCCDNCVVSEAHRTHHTVWTSTLHDFTIFLFIVKARHCATL